MNSTHELERAGTRCLAKAGLTEGSNANTIEIAAPNGAGIDYAINGYLYHKADTDNIAMNALPEQADGTTCLYLVQINADGDVSLKKGVEVDSAQLAEANAALFYPEPDVDNCPIGLIKVVTDGAAFTSGTTDLGAGTVTDTFYDVMQLPARPRES